MDHVTISVSLFQRVLSLGRHDAGGYRPSYGYYGVMCRRKNGNAHFSTDVVRLQK